MDFSRAFSTRAVLLKKTEYGEADSIITFYTEERGKLRAFAPSARKSKKRFGTSLDLFAFVNAHLRVPKGKDSLYGLDSTNVVRYYENIRKDLMTIAAGNCMLELFYEMAVDEVKNRNLFRYLLVCLEDINGDFNPRSTPLYMMRFLRLIGLGPDFSKCLLCGKELDSRPWVFGCDRGGIMCLSCYVQLRPADIKISPETVNIFKKEQEMAENFLSRVNPSRQAAREMMMLVKKFIGFHLGKELNSFRFLEDLDGDAQRV